MYPFLLTTQSAMKMDIWKSIPFLSKKLKPLRDFAFGQKITLENQKVKQGIIQDLASKFPEENLNALKKLIAVHYDGEDITEFLAKIIMLLTIDNDDIKRIVQYIISELASIITIKNDIILAVSPLHKESLNPKSITRGNAIKLLSNLSYHIPDIIPILFTTIKKIHLDNNSYVRRCMSLALVKLYHSDKTHEIDIQDILSIYQAYHRDIPFIKGPAIIFSNLIQKDLQMQDIHLIFRMICKDILKFNTYDATLIMELIHRYALIYLYHFRKGSANQQQLQQQAQQQQKSKRIYEEDQDIVLMKSAIEKSCLTESLAIIVEASKIALAFGDENLIAKVANGLMKFLNNSSEIKYISLQALYQIIIKHRTLLNPYYKKFYPFTLEKLYCKIFKLKILYALANDSNYIDILKELIYNSNSINQEITAHAIHYLAKLALKVKKTSGKIIKYLYTIMTGTNAYKASKAVMALADYVSQATDDKTSILAFCLINFNKIEIPIAKFKIITLIINDFQKLPTLTCSCFKILTQNFIKETTEVKLKCLELGWNLYQYMKPEEQNYQEFHLILTFLLELGSFDLNPSIREFTRFIKIAMNNVEYKDYKKYQSFNQTFLKSNKPESHEDHQFNYGFISHLAREKISGYNPLPSPQEAIQISTTHLRENTLDINTTITATAGTKPEKKLEKPPVEENLMVSNSDQNISATANNNIQPSNSLSPDSEIKLNLVDQEKLDDFFGPDDDDDDDS